MLVKIGRYKGYLSCYRFAEIFPNSISDRVYDTIQPIADFVWNNRRWAKQSIQIRIDPHDTWNMDKTLALIIVPMLEQIEQNMHGVPHVDNDDVPEHLRTEAEENKAKWAWVLNEMIWAFNQDTMDWEEQFYSGNSDMQLVEQGQDSVLIKGPNDTYKFDSDGYARHVNRINNGHRLFGKYYNSLWD